MRTYDEASPAIQTEVTILGAMLSDAIALQDATQSLSTEDFAQDRHRTIYRAILEVWQDNEPVDSITVMNCLDRNKQLGPVGGGAYLAHLIDGIPRNPNIESYVRIVKNRSLLNQAGVIFSRGQALVQDGVEDPRELISDVSGRLQKVLDGIHEEVTLENQVSKTIELIRRQRHEEVQTFVTSGIEKIDSSHGGYAIGELTVIGARPNVGKSTSLRQSVRANCKRGDFCHLLTPEMSADQVLRLFASQEAGVPFRQIRHAQRLSDDALANVESALREVMHWPLKIEDKSPLTPGEAISSIRSVKRKHNTKLAGLDYLQKLEYGGKPSDRHIYVTDALVKLAALAKNEQVAMVAISSLTEPDSKTPNRIPTMNDFRQSGDIKYEANTAILMHREIDPETQKMVPETSFIFGKARSDEQGVKKMYFDSDYVQFVSHDTYMLRFNP